MARTMVSLHMDVEDPINPAADDAALDIARIFTECGVRGSFCITGEKCRNLIARGRTDVIEVLRPHCLGLHTDTHSVHPTTMELLADVPYDEGCMLAYETQRRGYEAFVGAFERAPSFWGGAGNTWSPEINHALVRLGVPALVYSLTEVPGQAVHRFAGVLMVPQQYSMSETEFAGGGGSGREQALRALVGKYVTLFVGHPTRYRHERFWDEPYGAGRTPSNPPTTPQVPDEVYERAKDGLREFLLEVARRADVVGVDEVVSWPWQFREPTVEEREHFRFRTPENIRGALGWVIHRPGLSGAWITEKTLALESTLQAAELPAGR